ncbi:MAG: serine/threonine-protein kinase [Nannocystaceae bacterium]
MPELSGLQRYQMMEPIGRGSQGQTFRAIDRVNNCEVAIKVLRLGDMEGWKAFDLFERECAVLEDLHYPGIPRFLDRFAHEDQGEFFLVMELIPGKPLSERLTNASSIAEQELADILWRGLDILGYLHARHPPLIHRDIKPSNLIRRPDQTLVLIDFGGVRARLEPDGGSTMIGTFGYMAPEQLHGEATPATDIFALGATIAALAAGREADKLPRKGLQIDLDRIMAPSPLRTILAGMLQPDPSTRFQSVAQVREAWMEARGSAAQGPPTSQPLPGAPPPPPTPPPSQALARIKIPKSLVQLSQVPKPFSLLVWVFTAFTTGLLTVVEVAFLPLIFTLVRQLSSRRERPKVTEDRKKAIAGVRQTRKRMQFVAERTHPLRDERRGD